MDDDDDKLAAEEAIALLSRFVEAAEAIAIALTGIQSELAHPRKETERLRKEDEADRRARGW